MSQSFRELAPRATLRVGDIVVNETVIHIILERSSSNLVMARLFVEDVFELEDDEVDFATNGQKRLLSEEIGFRGQSQPS